MTFDSGNREPVASARARRESAKRKKQVALIGILAIALVIVVVTSPSRGTTSSLGSDSAVVSLVTLKSDVTRTNDEEPNDAMFRFSQQRTLPSLSANELTSVDLFRRPVPDESEPVADEVVEVEAPAKPIIVGAVYGAYEGERQSALINGNIVRSGQQLETGARVIAISPEGVHLQP